MTSIQTIVVEPGTPELAICARWRAAAFSVLQASFEEELRSLELFASDQTHGVALCSATILMRRRIASSVDVPRRGCHCLTRMFPVVSSECSQISSSSIHWERQSLR